jgi:hypothetical protein
MIKITDLTKQDIGRWVTYNNGYNTEKGMILISLLSTIVIINGIGSKIIQDALQKPENLTFKDKAGGNRILTIAPRRPINLKPRTLEERVKDLEWQIKQIEHSQSKDCKSCVRCEWKYICPHAPLRLRMTA